MPSLIRILENSRQKKGNLNLRNTPLTRPEHRAPAVEPSRTNSQSTSERSEVKLPSMFRQLNLANKVQMTTTAGTDTTPNSKASEAVLEKLSKLLGDTSLSDFMIKCNDREWKVHRFVLTLHSPVLQAACTHGFKEEKDRVIDLSEEDADCVGAFVYYLYNLDYDAALFRKHDDHLSLHVQMAVLGDKYDMSPLQDLALEKFRKGTVDSSLSPQDLATAATYAYDAIGATAEIRKIIVTLAITGDLVPAELASEPANDFERAIQACPGLCFDIMKVQQSMMDPIQRQAALAKLKPGPVKPTALLCPSCGYSHTIPPNANLTASQWSCAGCRGMFVNAAWKRV